MRSVTQHLATVMLRAGDLKHIAFFKLRR